VCSSRAIRVACQILQSEAIAEINDNTLWREGNFFDDNAAIMQ
jgi:hypothetical protein